MSHYEHLTINEREAIFLKYRSGASIRSIADYLNRSTSTISRELKRNDHNYSPSKAQERYHSKKKNCGRKRKLNDPIINKKVKELFLNEQWSPEEISYRLKFEDHNLKISFNTIYRAIYRGDFNPPKLTHGNKGAIRKLRHHGKTRHTKGYIERRGKISVTRTIHERPIAANNRYELGHWELDTVAGKTGRSCIVTLVDRKSRYLLAAKAALKNSKSVTKVIEELIERMPELIKTITPDRGKEFSRYQEIEQDKQIKFYFPDPHAPWQRGTNENTNGLLREYIPKGIDISPITDLEIQSFVNKLNNRPRKCLNWKTPREVFYDCC